MGRELVSIIFAVVPSSKMLSGMIIDHVRVTLTVCFHGWSTRGQISMDDVHAAK